MKARIWICLGLMIFGLCEGAMAQKNIDKVVEDMEKKSDTRITSIKKRDPKTRKVVKVNKTLRLTDQRIAKAALEAFEKDEEEALTVIKEKNSKVEYSLKFQTKKEKRHYILTIRQGNDVEITVMINPMYETGKDTGWMDTDDIDMAKFDRNMALLDMQLEKVEKRINQLDNRNTNVNGTVQSSSVICRGNTIICQGDTYVNGKRLKKGTHMINGKKYIVK